LEESWTDQETSRKLVAGSTISKPKVQTEEEKAAPKPKPTYPRGLNMEIFAIHDKMHDTANDRGYNSEIDFRALFSVLLL
jgi:hypothetical protein